MQQVPLSIIKEWRHPGFLRGGVMLQLYRTLNRIQSSTRTEEHWRKVWNVAFSLVKQNADRAKLREIIDTALSTTLRDPGSMWVLLVALKEGGKLQKLEDDPKEREKKTGKSSGKKTEKKKEKEQKKEKTKKKEKMKKKEETKEGKKKEKKKEEEKTKKKKKKEETKGKGTGQVKYTDELMTKLCKMLLSSLQPTTKGVNDEDDDEEEEEEVYDYYRKKYDDDYDDAKEEGVADEANTPRVKGVSIIVEEMKCNPHVKRELSSLLKEKKKLFKEDTRKRLAAKEKKHHPQDSSSADELIAAALANAV